MDDWDPGQDARFLNKTLLLAQEYYFKIKHMREIHKHITYRHVTLKLDTCMKKWGYSRKFGWVKYRMVDGRRVGFPNGYKCSEKCQYDGYKCSPPSLQSMSAYTYLSSPKVKTGRHDYWYTTREIPSEIWHSNWKLTRQNWRNQKIQHRYVNMYTCICSDCKKSKTYKHLGQLHYFIDRDGYLSSCGVNN